MFCNSGGANSIIIYLQPCNLHTGQYGKMAKRFSHQMSKTFHIFKWISFAVSTFVIVEETPSGEI